MKKLSAQVDFRSQGDESVLLKVVVQNEPVLFGPWTFDVRLGGQTLSPVGEWTTVCEHKERNCDYLEIDLPLEDDYRLQRSLLLNHKDKLLLICDTVLADEEQETNERLSHRIEICISPKLQAKISDEATEVAFRPAVRTVAPAFRVLPLAIPEWQTAKQTDLVSGTLIAMENMLILQQETIGRSLFAPLFFDLDADRLNKRHTWRQLSVGENLKRVPEDQAVGYRIQLGQEQFLLYRSLTPLANRTVLGHNLIDDFCFARFNPETGVDSLIAVEINE